MVKHSTAIEEIAAQQSELTAIGTDAQEVAIAGAFRALHKLVSHAHCKHECVKHVLPVGPRDLETHAVHVLVALVRGLVAEPRVPVHVLNAANVVGLVHEDADVCGLALHPRDIVPVRLHRGDAVPRVQQLHILHR